MRPVKTCVLVADGAHARVYMNEGPGKGIDQLPQFSRDVNLRPSRQIASDEPGRTFDSGGEGRHAMEPPTDPKRHEKEEFHRELAKEIAAAAKANKFDRLVLVAPPRTLGDLREEFSRLDSVEIHAEINKDLIKASEDELLVQLGKVMPV